MSARVSLLEADLAKALEAHERTGVTRNHANLAAFLHGYVMTAQRRRLHAHRRERAAVAARVADASGPMERAAIEFSAYAEGLRNGKADRLLGWRSTYAEASPSTPYSRGYRRGVLGLDEPTGARS